MQERENGLDNHKLNLTAVLITFSFSTFMHHFRVNPHLMGVERHQCHDMHDTWTTTYGTILLGVHRINEISDTLEYHLNC